VAVATGVVAADRPQLPAVARLPQLLPHRRQVHRRQVHRLVEPGRRRHRQQARRPVERAPLRLQAGLRRVVPRRPVERRRLAVVVAAAAAEGISRALQIRMAPLILDSAKWLAIPTACRPCRSGRRI
jgi:hypothetical protein